MFSGNGSIDPHRPKGFSENKKIYQGYKIKIKKDRAMVIKKKFKPVITRIKLNPEQAVLSCDCAGGIWRYSAVLSGGTPGPIPYCMVGSRTTGFGPTPCGTGSLPNVPRSEGGATSS